MAWADVEEWVIDTFFEWIIPIVSLMLLGLLAGVVRLLVDRPFHRALDLLLPALFVTLIVWQGHRVYDADFSTDQRRTVAVWYALGIYTMLGLGGWTVLLGLLGQADVPASVEVLTEVVAGGFFGLLVGLAQVRAERNAEAATQAQLEQEFLERQQETNEVLNAILRHHLLNGLTVIRGQTELLREHVDEGGEAYADTVSERAVEMTETIEEIRDITRTLTEEPALRPVDLAAVLSDELASVRESYPAATVEVRGEFPDELEVRANDLLGRSIGNVLENAVVHNDAAEPRVDVQVTETDRTVRVSVADDGPGIPEEIRPDVFDASERGLDSEGEGLGLFLTAAVLERYGGGVWIEAADDDGTELTMEFPKA